MAVLPDSEYLDYLTFRVRKLTRGETYSGETGMNEFGLVILGGSCSVESSSGTWSKLGGRRHVFDGLPYALYLPIRCSCSVKAERDCEDPGIVAELYKKFEDFRKAYDEDGLRVEDFDNYGATQRTLRQFLGGYDDLVKMIRDRMVLNPDAK